MLVWLLFHSVTSAAAYDIPPHIVFILADDLGWADTSLHGFSQIPTPNLDALASMGVLLNNYYVQPLCSPSRATIMTGLYTTHNTMYIPMLPAQPGGLPLNLKILPEFLKDLGYETHMVGKWHLGYSSYNYTPTYRGFDSFFGFHTGPVDYYDEILELDGHSGLDFFNNTEPYFPEKGFYATTAFTEEAKSIIAKRDTSKPLFLYLAHQSAHSVYQPTLLEAPEENVAKFSYISNRNRSIYAGMVDAMDKSVGEVLEALEEAGILENTLIVFSSDNGGDTCCTDIQNYGFNTPLRGTKGTLWEGGIRAAGFVWSPLLDASPRVSEQLMHAIDWLPTLYSAAGGYVEDLGPLDGMDMWEALSTGVSVARPELLLDLDTVNAQAALRYEQFKLVMASYEDFHNRRYQLFEGSLPQEELDQLVRESKAAAVLTRVYGDPQLFEETNGSDWRRNSTVLCGYQNDTGFVSGDTHYLFDIHDDPCEQRNLAGDMPSLVDYMINRLKAHNQTALPHPASFQDPRGYPEYHNGVWMTWIV
ncbi:arylsulfatase B-like isoform X1 [Amblyomma americanum]